MDQSSSDTDSLAARIQQLERERDELHKDIEQLCMQQAGPGYLGVATRLHFQRTAGLEQEIEDLKKKLAAIARENVNLREELSEAYHVKGQLADLHSAEVTKNIEAEKQLRFFQGCVAAAFAERDNAVMEAEKAKEKEELISQKLNKEQTRIEELTSELLEEKELTTKLQLDLEMQEKQNRTFSEVVDKFFDVRQGTTSSEDISYQDKCYCLLDDSADMWSFHDYDETSTSNYVNTLEEEVETLGSSLDNLQHQLRVGVQIENHLQKRVRDLEKEKIILEEKIKKGISALLDYHSQHRTSIINILDEGYSFMRSTIDMVEEKIREFDIGRVQELRSLQVQDPELPQNERREFDTGRVQESRSLQVEDPELPQNECREFDIGRVQESRSLQVEDPELPQNECRDGHISPDADSNLFPERKEPDLGTRFTPETGDASSALAQALQEKVEALLLLSQQEERHLLERNVHAALQKKMEELQRNLLQVTNEKVKLLMELAQLKQEYHTLKEKVGGETKQGNSGAEREEKRIIQERGGGFRNLLNKSYLKRWASPVGSGGNNSEAHLSYEGNFTTKKSNYNMNYARMTIENATLKESLESMEHLTSSVRRLHFSLLKVKEFAATEVTKTSLSEALDRIISEAKLLRTALGSSLPVSWSAESDARLSRGHHEDEIKDDDVDSSSEKVDFVSAAGFEMVELLILAAEVLKGTL